MKFKFKATQSLCPVCQQLVNIKRGKLARHGRCPGSGTLIDDTPVDIDDKDRGIVNYRNI